MKSQIYIFPILGGGRSRRVSGEGSSAVKAGPNPLRGGENRGASIYVYVYVAVCVWLRRRRRETTLRRRESGVGIKNRTFTREWREEVMVLILFLGVIFKF